MTYSDDTTQDGSGFTLGERVEVDDPYSYFTGTYQGMTENGNAKVRDEDTDEILIGSFDFVRPLLDDLAGAALVSGYQAGHD